MIPSSAATLVSTQKLHTCPNNAIIVLRARESTNSRKKIIISKTIVLQVVCKISFSNKVSFDSSCFARNHVVVSSNSVELVSPGISFHVTSSTLLTLHSLVPIPCVGFSCGSNWTPLSFLQRLVFPALASPRNWILQVFPGAWPLVTASW